MTQWKWVPVEPTEAMIEALYGRSIGHFPDATRRAAYADTIAAAPALDDALIKRMAKAMGECEQWSSFWSMEDAETLARAAIRAITGVDDD